MTDYRTRELLIVGDPWEAVLGVDLKLLRRLFEKVDPVVLHRLHQRTDPGRSWDVLVSEDGVSLWLDEARLSEVER